MQKKINISVKPSQIKSLSKKLNINEILLWPKYMMALSKLFIYASATSNYFSTFRSFACNKLKILLFIFSKFSKKSTIAHFFINIILPRRCFEFYDTT